MSTATEEDVDLGVNLDESVPCQGAPCTEEARWAGISTCCNLTASFCSGCKEEDARWREVCAAHGMSIDCKACGTSGAEIRWREL